jgi:serine protease Do
MKQASDRFGLFAHGLRLAAAALLAMAGTALAASSPTVPPMDATPRTDSDAAAMSEALAKANAAVVGVRSIAVDDARSIDTLGRFREGTGVVIAPGGLILTIGYLILEADRVDLIIEGRRVVPASVVAYDLATGFGLLQALTPLDLPPARLGNSSALSEQEPLMISSGGEDAGLSLARLVSRRAFSGYWEYHIEGALFTSPPRGGHSGAGLFNIHGELLGIGSLMVGDALGPGRPPLPGNMFVPIDLLKPILGELRERGESRSSTRAWLGLSSVEQDGIVRVLRISRDSPAEQAGIRPGDSILRIDGFAVDSLATLYKHLWRDGPQREITLEIRRGGQSQTLRLNSVDRMQLLSRPKGI